MFVLYICLTILIVIYLLFKLYTRVIYGFWSYMPVFHNYDYIYYIFNDFIVNENPPAMDKWCNMKNIVVKKYEKTSEMERNIFTDFIQKYYLQTEDVTFNPNHNNIHSFLIGHNKPSYISYYKESNQELNIENIMGVFSSRPLYIYLKDRILCVHYADLLCIHPDVRKKGYASELIQTQTYRNRHDNKDMQVCLFKRENNASHGIIPLVEYNTFCFDASDWSFHLHLSNYNNIIEINKQNFYKMKPILKKFIRKKFDCCIVPSIGNILQLLSSQNIYIYCLDYMGEICGLYVFRNCTTIIDNKSTIELIGSTKIQECNNSLGDMFIFGFLKAFSTLHKTYKNLIVEDVSDNHHILKYLNEKYDNKFVNKNAFYFYNFIYKTQDSRNCFIID